MSTLDIELFHWNGMEFLDLDRLGNLVPWLSLSLSFGALGVPASNALLHDVWFSRFDCIRVFGVGAERDIRLGGREN